MLACNKPQAWLALERYSSSSQRLAARMTRSGGSIAAQVFQQGLHILRGEPGGRGWLFLEISELAHSRVIKDAPHELELALEAVVDELVDSAARLEHSDGGLGAWRQAKAMDAVEALQEPARGEIAVDELGPVRRTLTVWGQ